LNHTVNFNGRISDPFRLSFTWRIPPQYPLVLYRRFGVDMIWTSTRYLPATPGKAPEYSCAEARKKTPSRNSTGHRQ
jgi:hypothetical protein